MNLQTKILAGIVSLVCFACFGQAQDNDFQVYSVNVPDAIDISAPGGIVIHHSLVREDQMFPEQRWRAYTSNSAGAGLTLSIGKFQHQTYPFFFHNSRIDLRVIDSAPAAGWTVRTATDETNSGFFSNVGTATVTAESFGAGGVELEPSATNRRNGFSPKLVKMG